MAGFCLEIHGAPGGERARPLRLVSLGGGETLHEFSGGGARALWSRWSDSRQLWTRRDGDGLWWIEGQPDRWPGPQESLGSWLSGRWGSFRGFAVDARTRTTTVFTDPLATRPIFYLRVGETTYVSDKLATLAALTTRACTLNWDALLEQVITGVVLEHDTTLEGCEQMGAGEVLELRPAGTEVRSRLAMPSDPELTPARVTADPSGTLLTAIRRAVTDVWSDRDVTLLLSGGTDSRLLLRLGGRGRKALTVTSRENRESRIARRVAAANGAEFTHVIRPHDHYHRVIRDADLLTAAMDHPVHAHFLGMLSEWRAAGVRGITHGFLFDSYLKACEAFPLGPATRALPTRSGAPLVVPEHLLHAKGDRRDAARIVATLSREGCERARARLAQVAALVPSQPEDGLDIGIEQEFVRRVSRANSYTNILSWMEEQDTCSVIFHPSTWSWMAASRPRDRFRGPAFRGALRRAGLDLVLTPSSNTGWPAAFPPHLFDVAALRDRWWYPTARGLWRKLRGRPTNGTQTPARRHEGSWPWYASLFREPASFALLEEGLEEIARSPLFDRQTLDSLKLEFVEGNDKVFHTLLAIASCGRWCARVRTLAARRAEEAPWLRLGAESNPVLTAAL
jgi:hypothetical protein